MSLIKDFHLVYHSLNEEGIFSEGDTISGTVTFTLTKQTNVKGLMVKAKGDANVHWKECSENGETTYSAHKRYFKLKQYLVPEHTKGTVLPRGVHNFKFHLKILFNSDMPSSFRGAHGKIVYMLEAKMSMSWCWPTKKQTEFKFVSKSLSHRGQVMCPQFGSVGKKVGVFSKGWVQMSTTVHTKVCSPGTVYLDIKFAFDPEVVFPLVIVPSSFAALQPEEAAGGASYSDSPASAFPVGPYPAPAVPNLAPYANMTSGFNYQWPQQMFPAAASSSAQHQTLIATPLFQQGEAPPSYESVFSPS
ncbi:arrestin domain-containing protein 2-like [Plectropomus leopardus]|uniref:arrestin domain-containing protein 2-like n=1 Tax=Plectropomus leopardus TaxID=160734 RepID=UPI001C4BCC3F|nr:arrestin domain-containing protein 2-like [Plectropomus leopardus]